MRELEIIEARPPQRMVRPVAHAGPMSSMLSGPVFSRTRDIIAANMNELLDRAEDPARMIRQIIVEMEEVLVDVRATAARSIADIKEMRRSQDRLAVIALGWEEKAQLALSKDRDDLARAALAEKAEADEMAAGLAAEMADIETLLRGYEADIQRLQVKLAEARARQASIANRMEGALNRARARELLHGQRTAEAFAKFALLERRADLAEGMADALGMTGPKSLEEELRELRASDKIDAELAAMKAAIAARTAPTNVTEKGN